MSFWKKFFSIFFVLSLFLPLSIIFSFNYLSSTSADIFSVTFQELFFRPAGILALWRALSAAMLPLVVYLFFASYFYESRLCNTLLFFGFGLLSLYYTFYIFLLLYRFRTHTAFDFNFFWYNRDVAYDTLMKTYKYSVFGLIAFCCFLPTLWLHGFRRIFHNAPRPRLKKYFFFGLLVFVINISTLFLPPLRAKGEVMGFLEETFLKNHKISDFYSNLYWKNFDRMLKKNFSFSPSVNPDAFGKNIFVLEFESLASLIMNENVTPQYLASVKQGVYFPFFYTTSVQTLRGQESFLCGLPATNRLTVISSRPISQLERLPCLPRLLKQLGFRTIFFKSDGLGFANTDKFMSAIGFDELHSEDIMKTEDPRLPWGYREDVFFQRIFEYIQRYRGQKIFVFIAVSSSNHWPFKIYDKRYADSLPFPLSKNSAEELSNSTFIQDKYLEKFLYYYRSEYAENTSLFLTSDQSWPIQLHPNNIMNEVGAYEENFLIPFAIIPANTLYEKFYSSRVVQERFSQTDVLPTLIQIFDPRNAYPFIGEPFDYELVPGRTRLHPEIQMKISVQPYGGGFISLVRYPEKYLFRVSENMVEKFDLVKDPAERTPLWRKNADEYLPYVSEYFTTDPKK